MSVPNLAIPVGAALMLYHLGMVVFRREDDAALHRRFPSNRRERMSHDRDCHADRDVGSAGLRRSHRLLLGLASVVAILMVGPSAPWIIVPNSMMNGMDSFPLMAVPFFVLAGDLMNRAGLPCAW